MTKHLLSPASPVVVFRDAIGHDYFLWKHESCQARHLITPKLYQICKYSFIITLDKVVPQGITTWRPYYSPADVGPVHPSIASL